MQRTRLTKTAMQREKNRLQTLRRVLPSLDLKRKRLTAAWIDAEQLVRETEEKLASALERVPREFSMLANPDVDLEGLGRVTSVDVSTDSVAGVRIPRLNALNFEIKNYSFLVRPHWVDVVAAHLKRCAQLEVELQVAERRRAILDDARKRMSQRVNLFEKVLIPRSRDIIRRISIHLGDQERAAVVRAKVARRLREDPAVIGGDVS
ncbi:MAG: V-type ATP synthase subunit D [Myxococcota bacterium]